MEGYYYTWVDKRDGYNRGYVVGFKEKQDAEDHAKVNHENDDCEIEYLEEDELLEFCR